MAYEIPGFSFTLVSAADYRTGNGQFRFVSVDGTGKAVQTGAGLAAVGVRQMTPNAGEAMTIVNQGIVMVEAGAAVTIGGQVSSDATGRAIDSIATKVVLGTALEAASAAGILIAVLLSNANVIK